VTVVTGSGDGDFKASLGVCLEIKEAVGEVDVVLLGNRDANVGAMTMSESWQAAGMDEVPEKHDSGARRELVFVNAHYCAPYGVARVRGVCT
jgi:hypothetical protein